MVIKEQKTEALCPQLDGTEEQPVTYPSGLHYFANVYRVYNIVQRKFT
ncbi:hypothetical protein CRENPOLYSF1_800009 [Crenothrix polyspora]|uniref:Uncharacterized protein n=1 Tax=Crenothrix polyspora TaxID=360316 RepID=A0A1R4HI76_9GAMM|nr:hypothetical protein CRENPOLYSF1_800009 [Crenothrix polyspora]